MSTPLTTLANVKAYLGITQAVQDAVITSLIAKESALIEGWLGRTFPTVTHTEALLNGTGTPQLPLPDGPVLSVSELKIGTTVIPVSADGVASGYVVDGLMLYLVPGYYGRFPRGYKNVTCSYVAGYEATESGFTSTGNAPTYTPTTGGTAASSVSVKYTANGVALAQVGSAPAVSHYTLAAGVYGFAALDASTQMNFDYYFIPGPVEQACIEMVGLDLKQRDNLGVSSKTLNGETVSYTSKGMTDSVKEMLQPYKQVWRP